MTTTPAPMTAEEMRSLREKFAGSSLSIAETADIFRHIGALTARIAALEKDRHEYKMMNIHLSAELAAARKPPEEVELAAAVLRKIAHGFGEPDSMDRSNIEAAADLLTRQAAALKEAEQTIIALTEDRAYHKAKLETARRVIEDLCGYASHTKDCGVRYPSSKGKRCDCGISDALQKANAASAPSNRRTPRHDSTGPTDVVDLRALWRANAGWRADVQVSWILWPVSKATPEETNTIDADDERVNFDLPKSTHRVDAILGHWCRFRRSPRRPRRAQAGGGGGGSQRHCHARRGRWADLSHRKSDHGSRPHNRPTERGKP